MGRQEKPNGGPADAGNREALARIARLISVSGEDSGAQAAANDARDDGETTAARDDSAAPASLCEPGGRELLEALPAGLAVCENIELVTANTAFALAFGYRTAQELEQAGGLSIIFPNEAKSLKKLLSNKPVSGEPKSAPDTVELAARSRSGREFQVPVAAHAIASGADRHANLLVLHPQAGAFGQSGTRTNDAMSGGSSGSSAPPAKKRAKRKSKKSSGGRAAPPREPGQTGKMHFLAKVSHEVRTPLNSIIGFAEIMKEEQLGPIGNDRYRGYIRDIHDAGIYALSLVNDLLDLSKIEAGEFELNFTAVDINEVAGESTHSMQPQAQHQRVLLRTDFAEDLPHVLADRRSIKQIVLNLVSNAIKFTRPGGQVIVSTQRTGTGGVRLRVRDTGIGMSKSEIGLAMKPFQQLDTAPRKQDGTGLGLPLTKALVEANRANFKLRSISDAGTRIDVTFAETRVANPAEE